MAARRDRGGVEPRAPKSPADSEGAAEPLPAEPPPAQSPQIESPPPAERAARGSLRAPAGWIEKHWDESYTPYFVGDPSAPTGATAAPQVRRSRRGLSAAVLIVALVVAAGGAAARVLDDEEAAPSAETSASAEAQQGSAPPPAPPASAAGVVVTVSLASGDALQVREVVRWADGGPTEMVLGLSDLGGLSGIEGDFAPTVADLRVTLDGVTVSAFPNVETTRWRVFAPGGAAPAAMEVSYRLSGAVVRSTPSAADRGLAVLAPLAHEVSGDLPVRVETTDAGVLAIACPGAADVTGQLCGRETPDGWMADLPAGRPAVAVLQVNLPPAG